MCDACRWPEAVQRMRAASLVASSGGLLASKTLMERAMDDVQRMQHVSRPQSEQLWTIERDLGMITDRPEKWGEEEEVPKKNTRINAAVAVAVQDFKDAIPPGVHVEIAARLPTDVPHDPATGECPLTDRDRAVPHIVELVQRVVKENAPRVLAAFIETGEPSSYTVTCHLTADPEIVNGVRVDVRGRLSVGVKGVQGTVSVDDKQVRMRGAE